MRKITSILVGSKYLSHIGDYGHLYCTNGKTKSFLTPRVGKVSEESEIRLELAGIYETGEPEFVALVEASRDAD